jgi:hypothetical protein
MKPNPINRVGSKNALCPYYSDCLDRAIGHRWPSWDCSECTHNSEQESLGCWRSGHDSEFEYDLSGITLSGI